jgi:hypothetical protein
MKIYNYNKTREAKGGKEKKKLEEGNLWQEHGVP